MLRGIYAAASAMIQELARQDQTANNIANASTPGFKRDSIQFESFPSMLLEASDQKGHLLGGITPGSVVSSVTPDLSRGSPRETGNPLDVLIRGEGFFVVETPDGKAYTREGSFIVGPENMLSTQKGHRVLGDAGPIFLVHGEGTIDADGRVMSRDQACGRIHIAVFRDLAGWAKDANGYLLPPPGVEPSPNTSRPALEPGYLEWSNVNPVKEMVQLITVLRSYEASAKALTAQDETLQKAVNEIAR